jgi:NADPH-dependent 2,4-dienoyl-CoA reductase/sulfur reductase-like enzyme
MIPTTELDSSSQRQLARLSTRIAELNVGPDRRRLDKQLVGDGPVANTKHHQILIVGGGTAGITVAASLRRRGSRSLDIAIVEPSETHYYQPCFTLVGAGAYGMAETQRPERSLIPVGVTLIRGAAKAFDPDNNSVVLETGDALTYNYLVVCTGLNLDWDKIEGLSATLGKNGVCSNYSPMYAPYTWQCVQGLQPGSRAVFTQPPLPFKCPGAPQKIVYLTADRLRRAGALQACDLQYFVHAPVVFGVPFFARELMKVVARYGIKAHFQQNLVAVDGAATTRESVRQLRSTCCTFRRRKARTTRSRKARWRTRLAGSRSIRTRCSMSATQTSFRWAMCARRRIPRPPQPCESSHRSSCATFCA